MIRKVVFTVIGTGMLAICDLQAQAMLTPMVTLKQPRFNVGVKAGFNSSMFFTDEISINGKKLAMAQNNYKVGYLAAVFCRFNLKKHHLFNQNFPATSHKAACLFRSRWPTRSSSKKMH